MICERFEIVVVPFPFVDSARTKPRPALVLSSEDFNRRNRHSVLAMITRAAHTRWPSDRAIEDLQPTGLHAPSVIRLKMFTLDNRLLARRIGRLSDPDREACARALDATFRD